MRYDAQQIIDEMTEYIIRTIETPSSVFGNLPVCPFAKKARLTNQLYYVVYPFDVSVDPMDEGRMMAEAIAFKATKYHMVTFVHPNKNLPHSMYLNFFKSFRSQIASDGLVAFSGHPAEELLFDGLSVRQDPYPNIQVISKAELELARQTLGKSKYYANWSGKQLEG